MATLEQDRAAFALDKVEPLGGDGRRAKYKTQLLKLPARLHNNGLGQTAAFLLAQGRTNPEGRIYGWLEEWLRRDGRIYPQGERLIDCVAGRAEGLDEARVEPAYRRASAEARALAVWLKRFAEAFLDGEA